MTDADNCRAKLNATLKCNNGGDRPQGLIPSRLYFTVNRLNAAPCNQPEFCSVQLTQASLTILKLCQVPPYPRGAASPAASPTLDSKRCAPQLAQSHPERALLEGLHSHLLAKEIVEKARDRQPTADPTDRPWFLRLLRAALTGSMLMTPAGQLQLNSR